LLDELQTLALNLRWGWEPRIRRVFEALSPQLWEEVRHNPIALLARLGPDGVEAAARKEGFAALLEDARAAVREHRERNPPFYDAKAPLLIGYFSLEFGIVEALPIYSGGLGVLAGDHLKVRGQLHAAGKLRAGVYASWLWDEQDPSVHLSGFDPAVRFAGVLERQDVGVKVDEAFTDGFERAFGGGARQLEVGWQVEAHAEAEDREIGPPETVGLYPVLPVAAGVADGQ